MQLTSAIEQAGLAEEQAALRRIATLVAAQPAPQEVFTAVTEEVGTLLGADLSAMEVFPGDGTATTVASWSAAGRMLPIGTRLPLDADGIAGRIFHREAPARIDDYARISGQTAESARGLGVRSGVGAPILVGGKLWGALMAASRSAELLPDDAEHRIAAFTELVATAIANTEARRELERLAAEQQALRTVAILLASGASPAEVFAAITASASELFEVPFASLLRYGPNATATMVAGCAACSAYVGVSWEVPDDDPGIARSVMKTGKPARVEDHGGVSGPVGEAARALGVGSVVGAPVLVGNAIWGVLVVGASRDARPLAADVGERLTGFTQLVTTTLINAEAREEVRSLLDEQETLRRVATFIAQGAEPDTVFVAVCDEAVKLFDAEQAAVVRLEADGAALVIVGLSAGVEGMIGMGAELGAWPTSSEARRTGRTARTDVTAGETSGSGLIADLARAKGFLSTVSAPILVEGRVWGVMTVSDSRRALATDTERRIGNFTELIATAIASRESRDALAESEARARELANEQGALRRVATLAARESSPVELLEAVAKEAARVLRVDAIGMLRFEPDGTAVLVAQSETPWEPPPLGTRLTLEGENVVASVHRTGRAARMDDWERASGSVAALASVLGVRSAVASPILVEGRLWGTMVAATNRDTPLPSDTESRIVEFAELLATAISNAESREALTRLADEQAALRRVAVMVAEGSPPERVFAGVAEQVGNLLNVPAVIMVRFEPNGKSTAIAAWGDANPFALGATFEPWPGVMMQVRETGRPAKLEDYAYSTGPTTARLQAARVHSGVGVPIIVDGSVWGATIALATSGTSLPDDVEARLTRFTALVATAVSNATTRTELLKSRTRLVSAADEARRRLERDLHDGIQQWLVGLALRARKAASLSAAGEPPVQELSGLADDLVAVTDELREISRGIHPAILSDSGLDDALDALGRRGAIRVDLDVSFQGRYDPTLEATVYYVVAESITNAAKHAQASSVAVRGGLRGDAIEFEITDDGVGGADPSRGTGLIGLKDRVDALGGTISFASPTGAGTTIKVRLPADARGEEHPQPRPSDDAASTFTSG